MDPEKEKQLQEAFNLFDKDKDGYLTDSEIFKIMKSFGTKITKFQVQDMIKNIDDNGDNKLDFEEFCTFYEKMEIIEVVEDEEQPKKALRAKKKGGKGKDEEEEINDDDDEVIKAFRTFDEDKDGKIPNDDFRYILERLGFRFPRKYVDKIFQIEGLEDDGEIDYIEFVHKWRKVPDPENFEYVYCVEKEDKKEAKKPAKKVK